MNTDTNLEKYIKAVSEDIIDMSDDEIDKIFEESPILRDDKDYILDPDASIYDNILLVFKMKMKEENNEFEYINPNFMREVLEKVEGYGGKDLDDEIWDWVQDMFGA